MEPNDNNGWQQWSKHVLITLKSIDSDLRELTRLVNKLDARMTISETKAIMMGSIGGIVMTVSIQLVFYYLNK